MNTGGNLEILKVCRHSFNTDFYIFSPAQIEAKKAEAKRSLCEAGICRAQADTAAMRGTTSRSLGQPQRWILETAEKKIYEARTKEQEASLLETEVTSHLITVSFSTSRFTSKYIISVERTGTIDQPAVQRDDRNRSKKVGIIRKQILKISKPCWGRFGNNLKKCTSGLEFKYFFWNPKHLCYISGRTSYRSRKSRRTQYPLSVKDW